MLIPEVVLGILFLLTVLMSIVALVGMVYTSISMHKNGYPRFPIDIDDMVKR